MHFLFKTFYFCSAVKTEHGVSIYWYLLALDVKYIREGGGGGSRWIFLEMVRGGRRWSFYWYGWWADSPRAKHLICRCILHCPKKCIVAFFFFNIHIPFISFSPHSYYSLIYSMLPLTGENTIHECLYHRWKALLLTCPKNHQQIWLRGGEGPIVTYVLRHSFNEQGTSSSFKHQHCSVD